MSELRAKAVVEYDDQWTREQVWQRVFDIYLAALIAAAEPPLTITYTLWMPAPPENRRLPMPLAYA